MLAWTTVAAISATFCSAFLIDIFYIKYMKHAALKNKHKAAFYSVTVGMMGTIGGIMVIDGSYWYSIPEAVGLYTGTLVGMKT